LAAKDNASASEIDKTAFWWVGLCGICHPGGGLSEFDRDGELYYDVATQEFGYEKLGKTAQDVTLDGDYCELKSDATTRAAPWDVTGVAETDCMYCHRGDRALNQGTALNWVWRSATLRAKDGLQNAAQTASVPAYAAAAAAAQGWADVVMATVPAGKPPLAASVDINYDNGLGDLSLEDRGGTLYVASGAIVETPKDYACWGCHLKPEMVKRGRKWFDPNADVHYAALNNLNDADQGNDIAPEDSIACTLCHPADDAHEIAKGNAILGSVRNDLDYQDFNTCRDCHVNGAHPNATPPTSAIHTVHADHLNTMSCEFCHIPYKTTGATLVTDNAVTGSTVNYGTGAYLSEDPLDPSAVDGDTKWYPSFVMKTDEDSSSRLFPVKLLRSVWWGDWDKANDVVKPIPLWKVRQITGTPGFTVPADSKVNTLAETLTYINALKGNDSNGNQIAAIPVLVKGGRIWHDDNGDSTVESVDYIAAGIHTESGHPFAINHNVLPTTEALGVGGFAACGTCHGANSPIFDRQILIDPFDENGNPVYKTVTELTGIDPN
jgi:hypothetical protein